MQAYAALAIAALLLTQTGCSDSRLERYKAGVADAAVVEQSERAVDLVPITSENTSLAWNAEHTKIRVATWKDNAAFEQYLKPFAATSASEDHVVWVTVAPRIQQLCQQFRREHPEAGKADVDLFMKQYLGLHPDWNYDLFVELWVTPDALFRPCVDPQTDDQTCEVNFPDPVATVKGIANYRAFYEALYYKSFRAPPGVPWTGLGYTYNWGNPADVQGASEFILAPGSAYEIAAVTPTMAYCEPG